MSSQMIIYETDDHQTKRLNIMTAKVYTFCVTAYLDWRHIWHKNSGVILTENLGFSTLQVLTVFAKNVEIYLHALSFFCPGIVGFLSSTAKSIWLKHYPSGKFWNPHHKVFMNSQSKSCEGAWWFHIKKVMTGLGQNFTDGASAVETCEKLRPSRTIWN